MVVSETEEEECRDWREGSELFFKTCKKTQHAQVGATRWGVWQT